jgi:hypothetical protein
MGLIPLSIYIKKGFLRKQTIYYMEAKKEAKS